MKIQPIIRTSHRKWAPLLSAAALTIFFAGCGSQQTSTPVTAPAPPQPAAATNASPPSGAKPVDAASLKDATALWMQINRANADLDKVIKSGKLEGVHEAAFKVRDLVKALPANSSRLAADKQAMLASQVKNVAQIAGMLDESGDAKKLKDTQDNQASLNDALAIIKGVYPPGALK